MYHKILVALENSPTDENLIPHIAELAKLLGSALLLVHVADGWAARHFDQLQLTESEEMMKDRNYLEETAASLQDQGLTVSILLARGDPPAELLKTADSEQCDMIAMGGHGHKLIGDIIHGSTISHVRHNAAVPVLVVPASR